MRVGWGAWKASLFVAGCLVLTLPVAHSQKPSVANSADADRAALAEKARALEARGRPDMAIQLWQQILLSAPSNTEALEGLAKDLKLTGSNDLANQTLDRLRRINPNDPNIARIQAMTTAREEGEQLRRAGELTRQGRNDDAMRIYRQLYGDQPPNGDIALAYYQTLYGTSTGKQAAIAGLRTLVVRNPGDPRCSIALGTVLTYDQRTRAEGIRILRAHPSDPSAQAALRQAYKVLFRDGLNLANAMARIEAELPALPELAHLVAFVRTSERGICR